VLHVDDEPEFAELTATLLERETERLDVLTETSADAALATVADHRIDCVVSDHDMPGTDGLELLEEIRADYPDVPFILFTGKGSEEVASKAISAGVTDYLQKGGGSERYALLANRIENAVERYRSQAAADRQTRRLETLIDNLPGMVYRCRTERGWPMVSVEGDVMELTGYAAADLESGAVSWGEEIIHGDDRERLWDDVRRSVRDTGSFECTYRIETADGATKWVWERGQEVTVEGFSEPVLEGFITELHGHDEQVSRSERRFEAIFEDPNMLVGLLEADGTVIDVNETALGYVDADRAELRGVPFWETPWWSEEARDDLQRWIAEAADGAYVEYEATHEPPNGDDVSVEGSFRPVVDSDGTVSTIVVSAKDVTDRTRREAELRQQNEQFAELANVLSHDLQSPISAVRGRLDLARETGEMEHVERAAAALERIDELRRDIVETLRTGEVVSETEPIAVGDAVAEVWHALDPPAAASYEVAGDLRVDADPDAFKRLLENLVGNSIEHGGDGVHVRLNRLPDGFAYEDDGPGIDPADRDAVFVPGFSTKAGTDGIGMGLASVRQTVLAHDWTISVTDPTDLGGARFEIRTQ